MERHEQSAPRDDALARLKRRRVRPEDMNPDAALAAFAIQQAVVGIRPETLEERGRRTAEEVRAAEVSSGNDLTTNQHRSLNTDIEVRPRSPDKESNE